MIQHPDPIDEDSDLVRIRRRKSGATTKGGQAFLRLLLLAEQHDSGQATRIAGFIASTDRPRLYHGEAAVALLEGQARINLVAALSRLAQ